LIFKNYPGIKQAIMGCQWILSPGKDQYFYPGVFSRKNILAVPKRKKNNTINKDNPWGNLSEVTSLTAQSLSYIVFIKSEFVFFL
jgi:hypothetical protein